MSVRRYFACIPAECLMTYGALDRNCEGIGKVGSKTLGSSSERICCDGLNLSRQQTQKGSKSFIISLNTYR